MGASSKTQVSWQDETNDIMDALPPGVPLSAIPLAANPTGAPPNFVDPPSLLAAVQAVGITLGFISLALIATRLAVSRRAKRQFGWDDGVHPVSFSVSSVFLADRTLQLSSSLVGYSPLFIRVPHVAVSRRPPSCSVKSRKLNRNRVKSAASQDMPGTRP